MSRITTVCGDIAPEELGYTDMHEHVRRNRYGKHLPPRDAGKSSNPMGR